MRKIKNYLPIIIVLICLISSRIFAQVPACTFTTCTPFVNTDNKQIYSAIRTNSNVSITGGTVAVSITSMNVQDNFSDTTNNRLKLIRDANYSGGASSAAWLGNVSSQINSSNAYLDGLYNLRFNQTYDKLDSIKNNQTNGQQIVKFSTAQSVSVTNAVSVSGTVTANAGTGTLSVNSQTINTTLSSINTKVGNQFGNIPTASLSYTIITGTDQASFQANLDDWLSSTGLGVTIEGNPQPSVSISGTSQLWVEHIWYR